MVEREMPGKCRGPKLRKMGGILRNYSIRTPKKHIQKRKKTTYTDVISLKTLLCLQFVSGSFSPLHFVFSPVSNRYDYDRISRRLLPEYCLIHIKLGTGGLVTCKHNSTHPYV